MMSPAPSLQTFDPRRLRNVLGSFTTGVVIVTSVGDEGRPIGLTVNSFNSVSMQPPLILWSLALKSPSLNAFRSHNWFAINILAHDQEPLCRQFATPSDDKFANVKFDVGETGVPVLHGTAAYLGMLDLRAISGRRPRDLFGRGQSDARSRIVAACVPSRRDPTTRRTLNSASFPHRPAC